MGSPGALDALLVATFTLALPAYSALVRMPRLRQAPPLEQAALRRRAYLTTVLSQTVLAALAAALWWRGGGTATAAGLVPGAALASLGALGLALGLWAALAWQHRRLRQEPGLHPHIRDVLAPIAPILPHDARELRGWTAVSLSAGVYEEWLYRGYLLALLGQLVPAWASWLGVTALFGLAHAYQGREGVAKTAALGAVFLGIRELGGSIWPAAVIHFAVNLQTGRLAAHLLPAPSAAPPAPPAP